MLLEVDRLDQPWDGINASTSEWENELGNLDEADILFHGSSHHLRSVIMIVPALETAKYKTRHER
jgi:hypothetical protein